MGAIFSCVINIVYTCVWYAVCLKTNFTCPPTDCRMYGYGHSMSKIFRPTTKINFIKIGFCDCHRLAAIFQFLHLFHCCLNISSTQLRQYYRRERHLKHSNNSLENRLTFFTDIPLSERHMNDEQKDAGVRKIIPNQISWIYIQFAAHTIGRSSEQWTTIDRGQKRVAHFNIYLFMQFVFILRKDKFNKQSHIVGAFFAKTTTKTIATPKMNIFIFLLDCCWVWVCVCAVWCARLHRVCVSMKVNIFVEVTCEFFSSSIWYFQLCCPAYLFVFVCCWCTLPPLPRWVHSSSPILHFCVVVIVVVSKLKNDFWVDFFPTFFYWRFLYLSCRDDQSKHIPNILHEHLFRIRNPDIFYFFLLSIYIALWVAIKRIKFWGNVFV